MVCAHGASVILNSISLLPFICNPSPQKQQSCLSGSVNDSSIKEKRLFVPCVYTYETVRWFDEKRLFTTPTRLYNCRLYYYPIRVFLSLNIFLVLRVSLSFYFVFPGIVSIVGWVCKCRIDTLNNSEYYFNKNSLRYPNGELEISGDGMEHLPLSDR